VAKDDQEEAFEKLLSATLTRTLDFVKFAEAKNAALLAFSSAWILASVNLLAGQQKLPAGYANAFSLALPLFVIAGLVCIASFLPRMLDRFHKPADGAKNLLFFGHVSTFEIGTYKERLAERYLPPAGHYVTGGYLDDLSVQIAVNSRIAVRKFRLFNVAACCVLAAIACLLVPPLWWGITAFCTSISHLRP
jgi:hypothetical protein